MKTRRTHRRRNGLSLLEVMLAIAILGAALTVIGTLVRMGFRSAADAKLRTEAQILCDAKMAEIVSGVLPLESTSGASIEEDPTWTYSVDISSADQIGLLLLRVTVEQSTTYSDNPLSFTLMRFVPDPEYEPEVPISNL